MLTLHHAGFRLDIDPARGGGITRFARGDLCVFLPARPADDTPLGLSSFALVPFSNRIENGRFSVGAHDVAMQPNLPQASPDHIIHGFGWLANWDIVTQAASSARLRYVHAADAWPWNFTAEQIMTLTDTGLRHDLMLTNDSDTPMPAGLGLHPYFPKAGALLSAQFGGVWHTRADGIPTRMETFRSQPDLLGESWDTVFTERRGDIDIAWPTHTLRISPDHDLTETVIYTPQAQDFFCIEPVSHMTDAINRNGMRMLDPGETWETGVSFTVV